MSCDVKWNRFLESHGFGLKRNPLVLEKTSFFFFFNVSVTFEADAPRVSTASSVSQAEGCCESHDFTREMISRV